MSATDTKEVTTPPKSLRLIRPLVGDGCERTYVYEPARPNDSSGLAVTLRPVLGDAAADYFSGEPSTQLARAAVFWERHGRGWNVADPASDPESPTAAAITAANFLRLPYPAQMWLADMLFGYGTATKPPAAGEPPTTQQGADEKN